MSDMQYRLDHNLRSHLILAFCGTQGLRWQSIIAVGWRLAIMAATVMRCRGMSKRRPAILIRELPGVSELLTSLSHTIEDNDINSRAISEGHRHPF